MPAEEVCRAVIGPATLQTLPGDRFLQEKRGALMQPTNPYQANSFGNRKALMYCTVVLSDTVEILLIIFVQYCEFF